MRMDDRFEHDHVSTMDTARGLGRLLVIGLAVAIAVAIVLLAVDNTDDVRVGYVFGDLTGPLWAVIVIAAAAGVSIGWLIRHRPRAD
jgi:uncharacterized integral membrane protein